MQKISQKKYKQLFVLCDKNKKGTLRQLESLADLISNHLSISIEYVEFELPFFFKFLSSKITHRLPLFLFKFFKNTRDIINQIDEHTLILASGRRSLIFSSTLAKKYSVIALLNPRCSFKSFKAVLLPEHDGYKTGGNIITFKGALIDLKIDRKVKAKEPYILTVLLGGDSKYYKYQHEDMKRFFDFISIKAKSHTNIVLKICASRRTNIDLAYYLYGLIQKEILSVKCDFWPHFPSNSPQSATFNHNPYLDYLHQADEIIVTSDSISMLVEACGLGVPVTVWRLPKIPKKFKFFFDDMVNNQYCVYDDILNPSTQKIFNPIESIKPELLSILKSISI